MPNQTVSSPQGVVTISYTGVNNAAQRDFIHTSDVASAFAAPCGPKSRS